jgi:hypothetical protein
MAYDPVCRWTHSSSSNVNQYNVAWTLNGNPAGSSVVGQGPIQDGTNYTKNFLADNPTVVLHAGDVVGVTVTADDTVDGLLSPPVSPAPLTIPASPPSVPNSVTLSLS